MKAIYVHLDPTKFLFSDELVYSRYTSNNIPEYAAAGFEQTKFFLKNEPIILTHKEITEFEKNIINFFNICKKGFPSFYKDAFWLLTLLRLYIVFLYAEKNNITEFIHLEYDNLIYSDLNVLTQLPPSIYFTRVGPSCSSAGFIYCNSLNHFANFIKKIKQLLNKGEEIVKHFSNYSHLSEMILIDIIYNNTKDVLDYLPILPSSTGSDNFDKLQVLFDGASYGQYLGGTNDGSNKSYAGEHHYIGRAILNNNINVGFVNQPFVIFNGKKIPILNLHIHSKKLKEFLYE